MVRKKEKGYELIAGERRLRAVRDHSERNTILARVMDVDDHQARRIGAAENLQREDLSAIECIEAIVEVVDIELGLDAEYMSMGKTRLEKVSKLLSKLDSVRRSEKRGYIPDEENRETSHKFMGRVEEIFKNIPKPMEWRSFLNNDLNLLIDISSSVQEVSIQHRLNKSQTRALANVQKSSESAFQEVVNHPSAFGDPEEDQEPGTQLREYSAKEINAFAQKWAKAEAKRNAEQELAETQLEWSTEVKVTLMNRLGIPLIRIAERLGIHRETVSKIAKESTQLIRSVREEIENGLSIHEIAKKHTIPEPLVWSIALEEKTDQERFEALGWGLRTWDDWRFLEPDPRFGDTWPGNIPAQLIAHTLFYLSDPGDLIFDPMAGGGVVSDVCLAFNRRCWSFDMVDRPESRPESFLMCGSQ